MIQWFDFFPFNLPPGMSFFLVYVLTTVMVFIAVTVINRWVVTLFDPAPGAGPPAVAAPLGASYRAPEAPSRPRGLAVGWLPSGSQVWTVAWLEGGTVQVQKALLAALVAEAWIMDSTASPGGFCDVNLQGTPSEPLLAETLEWIRRDAQTGRVAVATVRERALEVAGRHEADFEREAESSGMIAGSNAKLAVRAVILAAGVGLLVMAIVRMMVRAEVYGSSAPVPAVLVLGMIGVAILTLVRMARAVSSPRKDEYLTWLRDSTGSLRDDVVAGRRSTPWEVALAVAAGGAVAVSVLPMFAAVMPPVAVASSVSSDSSSSGTSCGGGSSCGGGGGCGEGGGCGGGGGCS